MGAYARPQRRQRQGCIRWQQIIAWQRHASLVYCVHLLLWYWTSMLRSIDTCQNKVSTDLCHVTISRAQVYSSSRLHVFFGADRWPSADFPLDCGLMIYLLKTGQNCSEAVNANPGLKLKTENYWNSGQKAKQYTESLTSKLQNLNQNFAFPWVSLIGLWKSRPRSYAFTNVGWPKSIYIY